MSSIGRNYLKKSCTNQNNNIILNQKRDKISNRRALVIRNCLVSYLILFLFFSN